VSEFHRFVVDGAADPADTLAAFAEQVGLRENEAEEFDRRFFDTPDGRLHEAQSTLEVRNSVDYPLMCSLVWLKGGQVLASSRVASGHTPDFADSLPPGPVFDRLREVIEMRTLLPVATVRSRLSSASHLDSEEKTTARVLIDLPTMLDGRPLPALVEVRAVRGYESETDALLAAMGSHDAFDPSDLSTADFARTMLGTAPYLPGKFSLDLDGRDDAAGVWREVMQALLDVMTANFHGTVDDVDSEYLHDFRVAVRRTRSMLQEGRGVLDPAARAHFREGFKWLGDITTPTRDADVHLLDHPKMIAALSPEYGAALAPLHELLLSRQRACQTQLALDLRSLRRAQLGTEWAEFLAGQGPWSTDHSARSKDAPDARRPAREVVATRIARAHTRLVRDGRAIDRHSAPESLHDLRKDAKRLRYLLECFGSVFPTEQLAIAVKPLKSLQDVLGEFQDTEVQGRALAQFGRQLDDEGASTETILAMGGAIEQLSVRSARARREFATRFSAFDDRTVERAYGALTEQRGKPGKKKR
jgi:CHAD domain-containing protein